MYEKVYRGMSLLAVSYFKALVREAGLHDTYDALSETEVPGKGQTFTVYLSGRETDKLMQKVCEAANG